MTSNTGSIGGALGSVISLSMFKEVMDESGLMKKKRRKNNKHKSLW